MDSPSPFLEVIFVNSEALRNTHLKKNVIKMIISFFSVVPTGPYRKKSKSSYAFTVKGKKDKIYFFNCPGNWVNNPVS